MAHGPTDEILPRDGDVSPSALRTPGRQKLDADDDGTSGIDPGAFHPAKRPACRCGQVVSSITVPIGSMTWRRLSCGWEVGQVGGFQYC
jgi:hypothetical protein